MGDNEKPIVVVLSRNYPTGLSVIRSLGAAGYTVDLVASAHKKGVSYIASSSKYVRNSVESVSKKVGTYEDVDLVNKLLEYSGKYDEKIVLFPTDDYTASVMDRNRSALEDCFIMPSIVGGGEDALIRSMDKTFQSQLAQNSGILTPKEWIISLGRKFRVPEDMVYPCYCKPIESISGYKREMAVCNNKKELIAHLKKLRKNFSKRSILIQEFLEIDYEIDLSGVCLDQEIIIPAIIKKTNVAQYEKGVTLAGNVVPFEELGSLQQNVIDMMKAYHYFGMFDLELNVVGDKVYFNEVNLRSGGPNYAYFLNGVNLPALFVKEALGERHTPEEEKVAQYGKSFVYDKVAWEDYLKGFFTKKEFKQCIAAADFKLLCNDDDPVPGELFTKQMKEAERAIKRKKFKSAFIKAVKSPFKLALKVFKKPLKWLKNLIKNFPQRKKKNRRNPNSEKPRVLVAGRNYVSNLSMARSLGEAGYEVEVLRVFQVRPKKLLTRLLRPDAYSKYVKAYHVCVSRRDDRQILKALIRLADRDRKMLLIPCCDLVASVADIYYDKLKELYVLPNMSDTQGAINRMMGKEVQKRLAERYGLPVLNSHVIKTRNGKFKIPRSVNYPCFVKPNVSRNSAKSSMRKCINRKELRKHLNTLAKSKDRQVLVEDYVEIAKEYSVLGLSTKKGVIGPGFFVAEEGGHDEHRGVAIKGRILPCSQQQNLIDKIIRFVGSLNYDGLFDVDLIETTDGQMYFVELNLRYGASGYAITKCGANLPGMFADYMLFDKPIDMDCRIENTDGIFVSEKVLIDEYVGGRMTFSNYKKHMKNADIHFVKSKTDRHPFRHFRRYYWLARATRLKSIRNK